MRVGLCGFNGIHELGSTYSWQKSILSFLKFLPLQNHEKCIWNKQITGFKLSIHCGLHMNKRYMNIQRQQMEFFCLYMHPLNVNNPNSVIF